MEYGMTMLAVISSALGIVALLLKYYPAWRREHEILDSQKQAVEFGRELVDGDDAGMSVRLSDEYDRVRREQGSGGASG